YALAINFQEKAVEAWRGHGPSAQDELKEAQRVLHQLKVKACGESDDNKALPSTHERRRRSNSSSNVSINKRLLLEVVTVSALISGVLVAGGWTSVYGKEVDITLSNFSYPPMSGADGWENVEAPVSIHTHFVVTLRRQNFRSEPSYACVLKDYKSTLEFFVAPFLVQGWETIDQNVTKKEQMSRGLT
ncbi:kinesin light chain-related protein 1, partial [Tanacetum coccineum]